MTHLENFDTILAGSRVLVAEDDPFIAAELQDLLAEQGAEVLGPVPTVRAALAAIETGTPDVAVLDVNLRDACSAPVVEALCAAAVPVVLVTGYSRHMLADPGLQNAPILSKPVRSEELMGVLHRLLSGQRHPERA